MHEQQVIQAAPTEKEVFDDLSQVLAAVRGQALRNVQSFLRYRSRGRYVFVDFEYLRSGLHVTVNVRSSVWHSWSKVKEMLKQWQIAATSPGHSVTSSVTDLAFSFEFKDLVPGEWPDTRFSLVSSV